MEASVESTKHSEEEPPWPELLGGKSWEGLLNPLNLSLRRLILRCGDLCQATCDAFNNDQNSKYAGSSRYGKNSFFKKVMFDAAAARYHVRFFLYATAKLSLGEAIFLHSLSRNSWDRESNWIGYIAAATDEASAASGRREIYIVWRGTARMYEWIDVIGDRPEPAEELLRPKSWEKKESNSSINSDDDDGDGDDTVPKVMNGWLTIYVSDDPNSPFTKLSARAQILKAIAAMRDQYKSENLSIILTGHSLGACLAILSALDLTENIAGDIPVTAIVFGSPQVGNNAFKERIEEHPNLKILQVRNMIDVIPLYPGGLLGYADVGVELVVDNRKSPSLKDSKNPGDWHNLQALLHTVAGWNGAEGEFELKVERSLALVNKSSAIVRDEFLIPASWWVEKNKGMVLDENGDWVLTPPTEEDFPVVPEEL
ncbi:phospholipase A1-IIdelta [Andrographis paniculata]|uniref:phospholipase A1-IIdelta n=1 Tax=Andrographis paniculata TaxID=175694 RepID=UPI0021E723D2|nr:phospholipase A1-IIdelta [Andrographis paniculata]